MPYKIGIHTPQNVIIEFEIANVWDRIVAFLIDGLIILAYSFFLVIMLTSLSREIFSSDLIIWISIILFLPVLLYSLIFEIFNNGQSPGKIVVNIQVVSLTGEPVSIGQYFLRWLFRLVDFYLISFIVAVLVIVSNEKGQRVGDLVAGTTVISKKRKKELKETVFEKISDSYNPVYTEVLKLTEKEIQIIKEVLANKEENRFEIMTIMAKKVEESLALRKTESSETFLKIIVKDFNYYNSQE